MTRSERTLRVRGLYGLTLDRALSHDDLTRVEAGLIGGVRVLQFRDKSADADRRLRAAQALKAMCARHGTLFVVNDDVELAVLVDADGVHVGREDASVESARQRLGQDRLVGASCYADIGLARAALAAGADYVAFGSFFPSRTKPAAPPAPLELLGRARAALDAPVVAIGGIDADNVALVAGAGASAVAVVSALFDVPDPEAAARELARRFEAAAGSSPRRDRPGSAHGAPSGQSTGGPCP